MKKFFALVSAAACLFLSSSVHAIPYKVEFTTSSYGPGIFSGSVAPQNPVTGTIFFTADALGANISSIDAVDLTIKGHAYSAADVGVGPYSDGYVFGAKNNGVGVNMAGQDDFYLILSSNNNVFSYAVNGIFDTWVTRNITYTYTDLTQPPPASVPEPGILGLLGLGAAGFALSRRRRA